MKKILLSLSIGLATAFGIAATAQAQDTNTNGAGGFISGQVDNTHWNSHGSTANRFGYGVSGGYRFSLTPDQSIGPELGYQDFGQIRDGDVFGNTKQNAHAVTLGGNYRYTLPNSKVYLMARAGYMRWHADEDTTIYGVGRFGNGASGNGWYAGPAVGYDLAQNFGVNVGYNFYRANANDGHVNFGVASVGAEYRF
jgi:OmpA-OmpF porin, OOP family